MAQNPPTPPASRPSATSFLAWVWAGVLIGGGAAFLLTSLGLLNGAAPSPFLVAAGVAVVAVPFAVRWLVRQEWWAALSAWIFFSLAVLVLLLGFPRLYWQVLGMAALVLIAAPFAAVWLSNRARWWGLIPAYALVALAALLGLTIFDISRPTVIALGLLAAALPFWVAYMRNRATWWPLLPAGGLTLIAVATLAVFTLLQPGSGVFYIVLNVALAAVCLALWLTVRRLDWALWLAAGFVLAATLSIWFPSAANWALVALALGMYIVYKQIDAGQRQKAMSRPGSPAGTPAQPPASPTAPPPAQPAAPAQAPPSPPQATPPPTPASQAPPPPQPSPGLRADREATAGHEARREAGAEGKPVVEFRPLDPFKARREQAAREEDEDEE